MTESKTVQTLMTWLVRIIFPIICCYAIGGFSFEILGLSNEISITIGILGAIISLALTVKFIDFKKK